MLVIFVALLLTTFSVLSVVSSKAQLDLSEKFLNAQQNYYEANSKANLLLSDIDNTLKTQHRSGVDSLAYSNNAFNSLKNREDVHCQMENGALIISYSVPFAENKNEIEVELSLEGCSGDTNSRYKINRWALVNNSADDSEYVDEEVHWWGA